MLSGDPLSRLRYPPVGNGNLRESVEPRCKVKPRSARESGGAAIRIEVPRRFSSRGVRGKRILAEIEPCAVYVHENFNLNEHENSIGFARRKTNLAIVLEHPSYRDETYRMKG